MGILSVRRGEGEGKERVIIDEAHCCSYCEKPCAGGCIVIPGKIGLAPKDIYCLFSPIPKSVMPAGSVDGHVPTPPSSFTEILKRKLQ